MSTESESSNGGVDEDDEDNGHDNHDNHVHEKNDHHGEHYDNHEGVSRLCRPSQNQATGEVP